MFVTFQNRLSIVKRPFKEQRIAYDHNRRIELKVFFDYAPATKNSKTPRTGEDWCISMEGNKQTVEGMKERIGLEITQYLTQRARQPINSLSFKNLTEPAERKSVA